MVVVHIAKNPFSEFYIFAILVMMMMMMMIWFYVTYSIFTGLGQCLIINWDFAGTVSIFGPDTLPVTHQ